MSRLRWKHVLSPTESVAVLKNGNIQYYVKLQQCVCIDSDSTKTYWEWQDVLMENAMADDFEEQER